MKKILFSIILMGAVAVVIFWFFSRNSADNLTASISDTINIETEGANIKGNSEASITLIEYSDFQCPACGAYHQIVKPLINEFKDQIKFVYKHFPLKQIHRNAEMAAYAAEAAGNQGKFWEMHDLIMENQNEWSNERKAETVFIRFANALNMDIDQFERDIDSKEVKARVDQDYEEGLSLGVDATPTFFLNEEKIINPRSYEEFRNVILQAIGSD